MPGVLEINGLERVTKELVDAERGLVIVRVEVGIDMPNTAKKNVPNNSQSHMKIVVIWVINLRDFWGNILRHLITPYLCWNGNARV